jgi:hypothetical protein
MLVGFESYFLSAFFSRVPGVRLSILHFMPDYHKGTRGYSIAD